MAKILSMNKEEPTATGIAKYNQEYDNIIRSARAAQWLFDMLENVFEDICNDIGVYDTDFTLNKQSADKLYTQTLNWIFPSIDDAKVESYRLIWELKTPQYTYTIAPTIPIGTPARSDDVKGLATIEREFTNGDMEYWNCEKKQWENKISNISDNAGLTK